MARRIPKKPKQPKRGASVAVWERYLERVKNWEKKVKAIKDAPKRKDAIKKQADNIKFKY